MSGDLVSGDQSLQRLIDSLGVPVEYELVGLALTHRSYAYEHGGIPTNERLEFLGDAILGKSVTEMLYVRFPELNEGELAKRRASLVNTFALAEVGRRIGLGAHIQLGRGEQQSGGADKDSILADTVEAVIGAVFLSSPDEVDAFVLRLIEPLMENPDRFGAAMDPKTSLQELAAHRGLPAPVYSVTVSGPDHSRSFKATVSVGDEVTGHGIGSSKKQAEIAAALAAWTELSARADSAECESA